MSEYDNPRIDECDPMPEEEFQKIIEALRKVKPPTREQQLRYAFSHGPEDNAKCYVCGQEICDCWE